MLSTQPPHVHAHCCPLLQLVACSHLLRGEVATLTEQIGAGLVLAARHVRDEACAWQHFRQQANT